ncbi:MAG TPA: hypothetical protein VEF71_08185 [Streptosporangiaceae bacterium]|nr:hypothetical protein [Streptosporangiaceae bacterium]
MTLMYSSAAISRLDFPAAAARATSSWRALRGGRPDPGQCGGVGRPEGQPTGFQVAYQARIGGHVGGGITTRPWPAAASANCSPSSASSATLSTNGSSTAVPSQAPRP